MKTERRHELQTNELADWLGKGVELVEQNARAAIGVVVALAVILAVYYFMRADSNRKRVAGWDRYFQAMNNRDAAEMLSIAEAYPRSPVGAWARLTVADNQLVTGINQLFQNRAEANDQLRRAVANYEEVERSSVAANEPLLRQRALWGLARAYESLNQLDKARAGYRQLADSKQWQHPLFALEAKRRLASLESQPTREFYDWFARHEPTPPPAMSPATSPELNLEALPDEPKARTSGGAPPAAESTTAATPAASAAPAQGGAASPAAPQKHDAPATAQAPPDAAPPDASPAGTAEPPAQSPPVSVP
jgi:hypothetical protein